MKIGVLALQGNFAMHGKILEKIGIEPILVKYPSELDLIEGLVLPGGESTTMSILIERLDLNLPLKKFAAEYPVLGTCAGLILMSKNVLKTNLFKLNLLNIEVERNGYGRQVFSHSEQIVLNIGSKNYTIFGSFIRAPKIVAKGNNVKVLATYKNSPVVVQNGKHLGVTFHPELDNISILHEHIFLGQGARS